MTFDEALEEYLQWMTIEKGRSRATLEAYRRDLNALGAWMAKKNMVLGDLTEEDLEIYFNGLRKNRQATTVARTVASVRGFFAYLFDEGSLHSDPSARLKGGARGRSLPKPLGEAEVAKLIDAVPATTAIDLRDRALLELLYGTGARVSEAVGLELSHLNFDEGLILVTGKGNKQRLVPLGDSLRVALRDYLGPGGRSTLLAGRKSTRVFINARSGPLTRQGVDLIVHKRALNVGIDRKRVSAHVFRHSCATHMLAHGADIRVVQELLGHASIATTQIYTAVSVTTLQREYLDAHPRADRLDSPTMNLWFWFIILVPSVVLHEVAHGYVAYLFGDPTAKERHRLTLNPLAHIDPFGTILMPALLLLVHFPAFGYAKPVPVNVSRLRKPRQQAIWVSLAGPVVNIILSVVGLLICRLTIATGFNSFGQIIQYAKDPNLFEFGEYLGIVNLVLAAFNLIPIPPLDGSAIIERFVPRRHLAGYYQLRARAMPLVFLVVILLFWVTSIGSTWIGHLENWWFDLL